jgi:hypothetical protein
MTADRLDITSSCTWQEDFPRPRWDLLTAWIETHVDPADRPAAWADLTRQWLEKLREALGRGHGLDEGDHFQVLARRRRGQGEALLSFAEECRRTLLDELPGVAAFRAPGKQVIVSLPTADSYYSYIAVFFPEGSHGGSAGAYVKEGYPHIVLCGRNYAALRIILAHELTHASLGHLSTPAWLQEGLAQMYDRTWAANLPLEVNGTTARRHQGFWGRHGLGRFWRGKGFSRPGKMQRRSYELAEILVRLLFEEYCPRWFGLDRRPRQRLLAFLQQSAVADCGEQAARAHLGIGLGDLAARFLGQGDWGLKSDGPQEGPGQPSVPLARRFEG